MTATGRQAPHQQPCRWCMQPTDHLDDAGRPAHERCIARAVRRPLVDTSRMACLGAGVHAVIAVGTDGTQWPWLLLDAVDDHASAARPEHVPHEQLGPLPHPYPAVYAGHRCAAAAPPRPEPPAVHRSPNQVTAATTTAPDRRNAHERRRRHAGPLPAAPTSSRCSRSSSRPGASSSASTGCHWTGRPAQASPPRLPDPQHRRRRHSAVT